MLKILAQEPSHLRFCDTIWCLGCVGGITSETDLAAWHACGRESTTRIHTAKQLEPLPSASWKHHSGLVDAYCESEALGGRKQRICNSFKVILHVGNDCPFISIQEVTNKRPDGFCLCLQALRVKGTSVCPIFYLNSWIWVLKGGEKHHANKEAKECRPKNAPFLNSIRHRQLIILTAPD